MSAISTYQRSSKYSTAELAFMGVKGHAYAIYHQLLNTINRETGLCNPKHKTLAAKLHISVSTVRRHLKALAEVGLIGWRKSFHKVEHTGKYRQSSNEVVIYEVEDQLPNICGDKNEQGGVQIEQALTLQKLNKETNKNISSLEVLRQRYEEAGFSEFDKFLRKGLTLAALEKRKQLCIHSCPFRNHRSSTVFLKTIADREDENNVVQISGRQSQAEEKEEAIILPEYFRR